MPTKAEAWFLYPRAPGKPRRGELVRESIELPDPGEDEVIAAPIYGCWEANMEHCLDRQPLDVCRFRKEPRVVLGNCGLVRITDRIGRNVKNFKPGDYAMIYSVAEWDQWGYPVKIFGYDATGPMGVLSTRMLVNTRSLLPVPADTRHDLKQWGAFPLRHVTAWANWRLAYGTFRLMLSADDLPAPNIWGWGGGVSLATLRLAKEAGCNPVMLSGNDQHIEMIKRAGITPVDRRQFGNLSYEDERFVSDKSYRAEYLKAEKSFLSVVDEMTGGIKVQIFIDYIGTPVLRATLKALGRESVVTTAGWKAGMMVSYLRATECIEHHQFIHTHNARYSDAMDAVAYAEANDWLPEVDTRVFDFDNIPELAQKYSEGEVGIFPVFAINPEDVQ